MPFFDWEQIVNVLGGYYSYTTQCAKSALINLRQKEAKIRLNAVLRVSGWHMQTPTHLFNYSWVILSFRNNAGDKQRRRCRLLYCFFFLSFHERHPSLKVLSDFHHWSNLYSEDLSSQTGHSRKCRDMANSIWEQRCLGLSETLCYRKRRGAMREDSARMVVWRGPWPVKRWNHGYAISWCEGLEPLLESPRGPAAVAERSKNSHRRDFTLGTQGGVKREIRSTSHSKAARSIPEFPWVPPITPSDLNCLPLPGRTQTAHTSVDKIVDTIS